MRRAEQEDCRCEVEVHGFSREAQEIMLQRMHGVFAASGCWSVEYRRRGRRAVEYSFEVGLGAAVELYCGLLHAGLELTGVSHRAMTELCVLKSHAWALRGVSRVIQVRLVMSLVAATEEFETADLAAVR